jgi:glycerol-3-phosphate dehydrogenase
MAKQVVDRLVEREGREAPCRTAELPLGMPASEEDLEPPPGVELPEATRDLLAFRYGHAARTVLALTAERPELASPIVPGMPDLLAEVVVAARHEQARSVGDVLLRRTRLGLLAAPSLRSADDVLPVARVLGGELGWDEGRVRAEAHAWLEEARAEGIDPAASGGEATGAGPKLDGHAP